MMCLDWCEQWNCISHRPINFRTVRMSASSLLSAALTHVVLMLLTDWLDFDGRVENWTAIKKHEFIWNSSSYLFDSFHHNIFTCVKTTFLRPSVSSVSPRMNPSPKHEIIYRHQSLGSQQQINGNQHNQLQSISNDALMRGRSMGR